MAKAKAILGPEDIKLLKAYFVTKEEFEELKEQVRDIPTRDELYTRLDEMMVELKANREENAIISGRSSDHEDRITTLEEDVEIIRTKVA